MIKVELEFILNSSERILYNRLSTASGLSEWFADDVTVRDNVFTFVWEGVEEQAQLISKKDLQYVRFKWLESEEDTFFEFRIQSHEITKEIALIVTDYAIDDEKEEVIELWETQINELKRILGA